MKWFLRMGLALVVLVGALVAAIVWTALRTERPVGFQVVTVPGTQGQAPFAAGVWYPTQAVTRPTTFLGVVLMDVAPNGPVVGEQLPLVVISHGNGGGPASHADLAMALANAGYVVAAPMHTGDNYADQSAVGTADWLHGRTRELHAAVDYMLAQWPDHARINPQRIGAFGFSAGGFTVLTSVGAQPDLRRIAQHCTSASEFACDLLRSGMSPLLNAESPGMGDAFVSDSRIKAAIVAAPGLGFAIAPIGLTQVRVPVQLWSGEKDVNVPYASNAQHVREALGSGVEFHSVPGAGHFAFLVPCGVIGPPSICTDEKPFDRKAFHGDMNESAIGFFEKNLKSTVP